MVPRKRNRLFLGRFQGDCQGGKAPTRIQRSDSCGKRRNNGTDDACPPQAADRMRDVEFVPTQLPLCRPFFRPSTALSFPCGKESGVENLLFWQDRKEWAAGGIPRRSGANKTETVLSDCLRFFYSRSRDKSRFPAARAVFFAVQGRRHRTAAVRSSPVSPPQPRMPEASSRGERPL